MEGKGQQWARVAQLELSLTEWREAVLMWFMQSAWYRQALPFPVKWPDFSLPFEGERVVLVVPGAAVLPSRSCGAGDVSEGGGKVSGE